MEPEKYYSYICGKEITEPNKTDEVLRILLQIKDMYQGTELGEMMERRNRTGDLAANRAGRQGRCFA